MSVPATGPVQTTKGCVSAAAALAAAADGTPALVSQAWATAGEPAAA